LERLASSERLLTKEAYWVLNPNTVYTTDAVHAKAPAFTIERLWRTA
jgi:hypothetical protein